MGDRLSHLESSNADHANTFPQGRPLFAFGVASPVCI